VSPGPIVVASANGDVGMAAAWDVLASGGSALDAVEAGTRVVEDDPSDHTVGYGGYPNLLGEVELDASIMDGTTRDAGAVGGLRGYQAAITVARAVLERLPHVLVVGEGAARLAAELGLEAEHLLTEDAERTWRDGVEGRLSTDSPAARMLSQVATLATDPERAAGTVNFLAIDHEGRMASAVSTSGWAWKYPGRLGDSPIIGAGNYCDTRYGAAACTGFGELALRAGTARTIVARLEAGLGLGASMRAAFDDLRTLGVDDQSRIMHAVAIDAAGHHAGYTTREGSTYVVRTPAMSTHETVRRTVVP
jgi:beta-aspartyl-peptidase (threonine type)